MQGEPRPHHELDEVKQLLLVAQELERTADRLAFAGFLTGAPDERDAVWTYSSPRGGVVFKDGRYELTTSLSDEPPDLSGADTNGASSTPAA